MCSRQGAVGLHYYRRISLKRAKKAAPTKMPCARSLIGQAF